MQTRNERQLFRQLQEKSLFKWRWVAKILDSRPGQLMACGTQHPRAGKIKLVAPAVTYDGRRMEVRMPPPWLSEHTEEVRLKSKRDSI
jgi:hypothetical protein